MEDNPLPIPDDEARLTLLNALPDSGAVDLVDPGLPLDETDSTVLIPAASYGEVVETLVVEAARGRTLQVLPAGDLTAAPYVTQRDLALEGGTANLIIPAPERLTDGSQRVAMLVVSSVAAPLFGSPEMVAETLYTRYLLPFELVAVLLLAAMIGAIVLSRHEMVQESRPRRPVVRRPLVAPPTAATQPEAAGESESEQHLQPEAGK
ncbi:MAG: NADH-quinone oxidoreductase subunit J [Anaerolineae bacterium]|nr:NADH-quinone oxidoreductase subunit J [Anaerolineae bacterium]